MNRFSQPRQGRVRFLYVFLLLIVLLGTITTALGQFIPQKAAAAATCGANANFPLKLSQINTGACLGKVDNNLYSFEITFCSTSSLNATVSGNSLAPAPNGTYGVGAVNNCGDISGAVYATQKSGNDSYGDPVSVLVKANATCTDTITINGTDKTTGNKGTATANPCDLINQFKSQGTVSFQIVYKEQVPDTNKCSASKQFPLAQSPYNASCVGIVDGTQQSFQFIVDTSLIKNTTNIALDDPSSALKPAPDGKGYTFTNPHVYMPGLLPDDYISDPSGKGSGGSTMGILVKGPACNASANLVITVTDSSNQNSTVNVNVCDLLNAAKTCKTWIFTFAVNNHQTTDFNFLDYNCGQPLPPGCDHETRTKFDPYIESRYNRTECLGRLADPADNIPGLISAEFVVTIANATTKNAVTITVSGDNVAARNVPQLNLPQCQPDQTTNCSNLTPDQISQLEDPFERIDDTRYHSGPVPTTSFLALYRGTCNILNTSGCGQPPDGKLYPQFSGTGIFAPDPCDPNATVTITATEPTTGYTGTTAVHVCDIIKARYSIAVTIKLAAPQGTCTTGTGWAGAVAWVLCPLTELMVGAMSYIENNLIIPYLTVSPLGTDANNPVYKLWQVVRNVANILFVIAFLIIIFSQATSFGLSSYGIKRLLPRLILVIVVANLSYYMVSLLIDVFNIFGSGIAQLVMGVLANAGAGGHATSADWTQFFSIGAVALGAVIVSSGAAIGWLGSLILIVFLILLVVVIVLTLRQMLIILLVIGSPILAVAKLLPNTEHFADDGVALLFRLLLMYPLIVLIFAMGKIVAALLSSGSLQLSTGDAGSTEMADAIKVIFATFAQAFPLILVPALLFEEESLLGKAAKRMHRYGEIATTYAHTRYKNTDYAKYREHQKEHHDEQVAAGNYTGTRLSWLNPVGHTRRLAQSRINRTLNKSTAYNMVTRGYGANQALQDVQHRMKARSDTRNLFNGDYGLAEAWVRSRGNRKNTYKYTVKPGGETINKIHYSGGAVIDRNAYDELETPGQKLVFDQMANSQLGHSADSYIAAMEMLSESGRGTSSMLHTAEHEVEHLNPASSQVDINALRNQVEYNWREHGRGDLADVDLTSGAVNASWSSMKPSNLSRHIFDTKLLGTATNPATGSGPWYTKAYVDPNDPTKSKTVTDREISKAEADYRSYLMASPQENMRQLVEALPHMENRARRQAEIMVFDMLRGQDRTVYGNTVPGEKFSNGNGNLSKVLDELRTDLKLQNK